MKKYSFFFICSSVGFLVSSFTFSVQAQFSSQNRVSSVNRSTLSGFVFDPQRRPVPAVQVELMNEVNSVLQRTKTDGSGRFFFRGLSGGRFTVRVLPFGTNYEEQTQDVEVASVSALGRPIMDNAQQDIYLKLRRDNNEVNQVTGTVFVQEIPEDTRKTYEKAVADLNDNKIEEGTKGLEDTLKLFPTYYLALEKLGGIYISQQKYENARDIFSRAVTVNDGSFYSWYGLSYSEYSLKQSGPAIEAARKAVTLNSNSVEALLLLGISLRLDKQYNEAEKSLKQAGKIAKGKSPDVHWNLALLYAHNLKRYSDAADELELYLKTNPDNSNAETVKKLIKQFRENPPSSD